MDLFYLPQNIKLPDMTTFNKNTPGKNYQNNYFTNQERERALINSHEVDDKLIGDDLEIYEALEPDKQEQETTDSESGY